MAGLKGYVTNLRACPDGTPVTPEFVIGSYHQLFQIERSFRMAKSDVRGCHYREPPVLTTDTLVRQGA